MKIKILALMLMLFSAFTAHAQIGHNMLTLRPITAQITAGNTFGGSFYGVYFVPTSQGYPYNNSNPYPISCSGSGNTYTYHYTASNGGSYAARTYSVAGGGTISVAAGTLSPTGGNIIFTCGGSAPFTANATQTNHTGTFNLLGMDISVTFTSAGISGGNAHGCPQ